MKKTTLRFAVSAAVVLGASPAIAHADTEDAVQPGVTTPAEDNAAPAEADSAQPGTEGGNAADAGNAQPGTETAPADGGNTQPGTSPAPVDNGGETPAQPGTEAPAVDNTPAAPAPVDEAPAQPGTEEPTAPAEPAAAAQPAQPVQPAEPATPAVDTPVAPANDETTTPVVTEPVFTPVSNNTPEDNAPAAPANDAPTQPVDPAVPAEPAAPAQPAQPAPKPAPMKTKVLAQGAIKANLGSYSINANYITTPGQTVANASASNGRVTATAPTLSYGTYHDGVAEIGVGTNRPSPVKLGPVTTGVIDATNAAIKATPKPVRDATKLPAKGDYRIGTPAAGAHIAWKS